MKNKKGQEPAQKNESSHPIAPTMVQGNQSLGRIIGMIAGVALGSVIAYFVARAYSSEDAFIQMAPFLGAIIGWPTGTFLGSWIGGWIGMSQAKKRLQQQSRDGFYDPHALEAIKKTSHVGPAIGIIVGLISVFAYFGLGLFCIDLFRAPTDDPLEIMATALGLFILVNSLWLGIMVASGKPITKILLLITGQVIILCVLMAILTLVNSLSNNLGSFITQQLFEFWKPQDLKTQTAIMQSIQMFCSLIFSVMTVVLVIQIVLIMFAQASSQDFVKTLYHYLVIGAYTLLGTIVAFMLSVFLGRWITQIFSGEIGREIAKIPVMSFWVFGLYFGWQLGMYLTKEKLPREKKPDSAKRDSSNPDS